ncbi:hypothetical protein AMTRI_Chr09g39070 [Amborella trichopoda]
MNKTHLFLRAKKKEGSALRDFVSNLVLCSKQTKMKISNRAGCMYTRGQKPNIHFDFLLDTASIIGLATLTTIFSIVVTSFCHKKGGEDASLGKRHREDDLLIHNLNERNWTRRCPHQIQTFRNLRWRPPKGRHVRQSLLRRNQYHRFSTQLIWALCKTY